MPRAEPGQPPRLLLDEAEVTWWGLCAAVRTHRPTSRANNRTRETSCRQHGVRRRRPDEPSGSPGLRQPEPADCRCAARRRSRTTSSSRRSATSTASGAPSGSSMHRHHGLRLLRGDRQRRRRACVDVHPGEAVPGRRQRPDLAIRFSTVAGGRDSRWLLRPARLRGEVLHRRRQLGSCRRQPRRVLHPRRDQVSRLHPFAKARPGHLELTVPTGLSTSFRRLPKRCT